MLHSYETKRDGIKTDNHMRAWISVLLTTLACCCSSGKTAEELVSDALSARISRVENGLLPPIIIAGDEKMKKGFNIEDRMSEHNVPSVSVAVIHDGILEWAKTYGVLDASKSQRANKRTLFQAASISKPVTALAALELVDDGRLSLDDDVNSYLDSWKIPDSRFTISQNVTLAHLLSHCAGLPRGGYDGYESGEEIPTLLQILNGQEPANSPAVELVAEPGSQCVYSGAGYSITQQLIIDITGEDFNSFLRKTVFEPLGMNESYFLQPLPEHLTGNAAAGHHEDMTVYEGYHRTYPELAAAGLWTTPTDLSLFLIDILAAIKGASENVVTKDVVSDMLTRRLGLSVVEKDGRTRIGHSGMNRGFRSMMVAYVESGDGVVAMANAENGNRIISELVRAVSREYGWPDYKPEVKEVVTPDKKILTSLAGKYEHNEFIFYELTMIDNQLFYQFRSDPKQPLYAKSRSEFFTLDGAEMTVLHDAQGAVSGIEVSNYRGTFIADRME